MDGTCNVTDAAAQGFVDGRDGRVGNYLGWSRFDADFWDDDCVVVLSCGVVLGDYFVDPGCFSGA